MAVSRRQSRMPAPPPSRPVRHFVGSFCQLSSRWPAWLAHERGEGPAPNAFLPELSNGALMDLGCYAVSAIGLALINLAPISR
jgi:hypothetical protein